MGFIKEYIDSYSGLTISNAYFRIIQIMIDPNNKTAEIIVAVYNSHTDRQNGKTPIVVKNYGVDKDKYDNIFDPTLLSEVNMNSIKSSYLWLKSKPEFSDAVDA